MKAIASQLESALNRKSARFTVQLSNVGNPDYGQNPKRPLPGTVCGWAHLDTLEEIVEICLAYIAFFDLGGGNWTGGKIVHQNGVEIGQVSYNGRVWKADGREITCAS